VESWIKKVLILAVWWLWMPVVYAMFWLLQHLVFEGMDWSQRWDQYFMANFWSGSVMLWLWLTVGFIGTAVIIFSSMEDDFGSTGSLSVSLILGVIAVIVVIATFVQLFRVEWDNDKDFARYYNKSTVFYTPNLQAAPDSLARLLKGAYQPSDSKCDLVGNADVPSCIKQGTLADTGWEPRVGSLDGATIALQRTSGDIQKVSLNAKTLAYLNEWHGQSPRWSGVLDGKGITQSLGGVSEWEGTGQPIQCLFKGPYAIDKALSGGRSNSLGNLLAVEYPALRYDTTDVWGYCDGDQPIVVIPMRRQIYFKDRTVDTAGGVVTVQGDHGKTKLTYYSSVAAGQFPGPVYPASLVTTQRSQAAWAAGRQNQDRNGFGYEPATSVAQAGNVSEYLLRNKATGRLEWVTPLTLRHSSSELFVAYAVSPADTVSDKVLNPLTIYVLADNDPRRINIDNLEADALNYLAKNAGTFISNGGKLVEFTPVDGDIWRAFGELNGRVVYRLDISASKKIETQLVSLDVASTTDHQATNTDCGLPLAQLTPNQLTNCIKQLADELANRQQPSSTPPSK